MFYGVKMAVIKLKLVHYLQISSPCYYSALHSFRPSRANYIPSFVNKGQFRECRLRLAEETRGYLAFAFRENSTHPFLLPC